MRCFEPPLPSLEFCAKAVAFWEGAETDGLHGDHDESAPVASASSTSRSNNRPDRSRGRQMRSVVAAGADFGDARLTAALCMRFGLSRKSTPRILSGKATGDLPRPSCCRVGNDHPARSKA